MDIHVFKKIIISPKQFVQISVRIKFMSIRVKKINIKNIHVMINV